MATSAQTNLIVNGGFESPTAAVVGYTTFTAPTNISGWTVASGGVDLVDRNFYASASGFQSLDLNAFVSGSTFQDVTTRAGEAYLLTFAFAANSAGDDPCCPSPAIKSMEVSWGTTILGTVAHDTTGHSRADPGWHEYTFSVVGTGTDRLWFRSLTPGSSGPAIDDVRIIAVPEPSAILLLAAGCCCLVVFARRTFKSNDATYVKSLQPRQGSVSRSAARFRSLGPAW